MCQTVFSNTDNNCNNHNDQNTIDMTGLHSTEKEFLTHKSYEYEFDECLNGSTDWHR